MTDTELILSRLDVMQCEIGMMRADMSEMKSDIAELKADVAGLKADVEVLKTDMAGVKADVEVLKADMTGVKADIVDLRTEMSDMRSELGGKIEAVRLLALATRDRLDTLEFALQTEISKTYDLAQENAKKLSRLLRYKDKIVPMPI